ncbi:aldose 1-epimerase family protein [Dokdonia sp. Hel_I_53]|uniref:aldose 1-epimerase family protein n=1 Tax=Dokdonia sp. Hel_I_53 TaxID=1566287 RepID=UPI00119BFBC0|nr:aldose 1-epimerase family protein [Dokdonia sp. Hel_I_53]TVZ53359.1 galactose mutarotase-like enzyme [Dokdonia sp. Hel_I_53]
MYSIENDFLTCDISPDGAEIRSLKSKQTGKESIWQVDPTVWRSSSPILFPAIGTIKGDKILYKGVSYDMPKHGIVRDNKNLTFHKKTGESCSFMLSNSQRTLKQYPFAFFFKVTYTLEKHCLQMTYEIHNLDSVDLYFTCGGHTAYACPITSTKKLSDYVIEIPTKKPLKSHMLDPSGLLTSKFRDIEYKNGFLSLSATLFNEDALIFSDIDYNWVRLREKSRKKGIVVHFEGYPNLALWSKPKADYICIEPWLGLPDHINESLDITQKESYKALAPNESYKITIETKIE